MPEDLRFHDRRHGFATKLPPKTGDIELLQRALHVSQIETTDKDGRVLDGELLAGMEEAEESRKNPGKPRRRGFKALRFRAK